jgi:hypothetical protein
MYRNGQLLAETRCHEAENQSADYFRLLACFGVGNTLEHTCDSKPEASSGHAAGKGTSLAFSEHEGGDPTTKCLTLINRESLDVIRNKGSQYTYHFDADISQQEQGTSPCNSSTRHGEQSFLHSILPSDPRRPKDW